MNVCRRRAKEADIAPEQKWDFISLTDFKCSSCLSGTAYVYLFISLIISIAVYGVDTFTAINLLAFNRWSGEIEPVIPLNVSKWIFSACIIASWVNLGFEYIRAIHVMRRGAVAESYLDSLAVRLQCIRMGKNGKGFRRFLVFAELTKSKKGVEYVALFTYFSFQSWVRIVLCSGPRQVVNALTLYSVFRAQLEPTESKDVGDAFVRFFKNVGVLADKEHQQAVIISGMLFTLIIWVFAALSLILAVIFYIVFLWHHIPAVDGSLAIYCERKINQRLKRIVSAKVNKALEADERRRRREEEKAIRKGEKPILGRQATLPVLFNAKDEDKLPNMPILDRLNTSTTTTTLPAYTSRPGTPSGQPTIPAFEMDHLDQKRPYGGRTTTGSSTTSNAPLLGNASDMSYGRSGSPAPSLRSMNNPPPSIRNVPLQGGYRGPPTGQPRLPQMFDERSYTSSPVPYDSSRSPASMAPPRQNPSFSTGYPPAHANETPMAPPRQNSTFSTGFPPSHGDPVYRSNTPMGPPPSMGRRIPFDPAYSQPQPAQRPPNATIPTYNRNRTPSPAPTFHSANPGYQNYNPNMRIASASSYSSYSSAPSTRSAPMANAPSRTGFRPPPLRTITNPHGPDVERMSNMSASQPSPRENPGFPFPDMSRPGATR